MIDFLGIGKLASKGHDVFQLHKARRKAKMVNKMVGKALAAVGMQRFSKMVATPVGILAGYAVTKLPFLAPMLTEEWVFGISLSIATLIVGWFPANVEPKKARAGK